jgi:hypothetical protein
MAWGSHGFDLFTITEKGADYKQRIDVPTIWNEDAVKKIFFCADIFSLNFLEDLQRLPFVQITIILLLLAFKLMELRLHPLPIGFY